MICMYANSTHLRSLGKSAVNGLQQTVVARLGPPLSDVYAHSKSSVVTCASGGSEFVDSGQPHRQTPSSQIHSVHDALVLTDVSLHAAQHSNIGASDPNPTSNLYPIAYFQGQSCSAARIVGSKGRRQIKAEGKLRLQSRLPKGF